MAAPASLPKKLASGIPDRIRHKIVTCCAIIFAQGRQTFHRCILLFSTFSIVFVIITIPNDNSRRDDGQVCRVHLIVWNGSDPLAKVFDKGIYTIGKFLMLRACRCL